MHLVHPPKILHSHCFQFLLGITVVPREIQGNGYANVWGGNKVHYGLCAYVNWNGELQNLVRRDEAWGRRRICRHSLASIHVHEVEDWTCIRRLIMWLPTRLLLKNVRNNLLSNIIVNYNHWYIFSLAKDKKILKRFSVTFTANGKSKFVPREQVFP